MNEETGFSFVIQRFKERWFWNSHSACRKSRIFLESQLLIFKKGRDQATQRLDKTERELGHARQEIKDLKRINKRLRNLLRDKKGKHAN